ncbi:MAG: hypothetical protein RJB39_554 [Candidatus Parcubacteria bacterium]|jgi:uncharacterized protein (TIGR00159 family)
MPQFGALYAAIRNITFTEVIDIALVAGAIYILLLFIKQTKSYFLAGVTLFLLAINFISQNLNLSLTRSIIQPAYTLIFIVIAIVFQREIRRFFKWIVVGQLDLFTSAKQISKGVSAEIAEALLHMADKHIGAIIVFTGRQDLDDITEGGQALNGEITKEILLSIFDSSSPGHDGAVVIDNNNIKQFGAHLPLAREYSNYRQTGTRHRAAAGITEDTDAIALVVSEERGVISIFQKGKLKTLKDEESLREELKSLTGESETKNSNFWHFFFIRNVWVKLASVAVAFVLWTFFYAQVGIIKKEYTVPLSFQLLSPSLEIDATSAKKQIKITVEGKSNDISALDAAKLEARVDAKNFKVGTQQIDIIPAMINLPSFITISEIAPETVWITFTQKDAGSSGQ